MLSLALACVLLPSAFSAELELLPGQRLTPLLAADPLETANTLTFRTGEPSLEGVVGDTAGLLRLDAGQVALQLELGAAILLGFLPGDGFTFGIATVDGLIRLPVSMAWGPWRASLEWAHISAHHADGVRYGEALPDKTDGYSREHLRLLASCDLPWVQPYLAAKQVFHSISQVPGLGLQAGLVAHGQRETSWYQALDLAWNADTDWRTRLSYQGGLRLRGAGSSTFRTGLAAYRGPALAGKRAGENDAYLGAIMAFDWHGGWNRWTNSSS